MNILCVAGGGGGGGARRLHTLFWPQNQNFLKIHTPLCKNPYICTPFFKSLHTGLACVIFYVHSFHPQFELNGLVKGNHRAINSLIMLSIIKRFWIVGSQMVTLHKWLTVAQTVSNLV